MNYSTKLAKLLTAWIFMAGSGSLLAQEKPITLHEAIDLSIKNSKQLRISKAKMDEAAAAAKQAVQGQLPDLKVSGAYDRVTQPNIGIGKELSGGSSGSSGGSGGGTGGSGGSSGGTAELSNIKVNQAIYGIANLSLPLFSGFKIRYGIESAKYLEKAAMLDADNDREEVILNTISAYANLYKAHVNVILLQENLSQS